MEPSTPQETPSRLDRMQVRRGAEPAFQSESIRSAVEKRKAKR